MPRYQGQNVVYLSQMIFPDLIQNIGIEMTLKNKLSWYDMDFNL